MAEIAADVLLDSQPELAAPLFAFQHPRGVGAGLLGALMIASILVSMFINWVGFGGIATLFQGLAVVSFIGMIWVLSAGQKWTSSPYSDRRS